VSWGGGPDPGVVSGYHRDAASLSPPMRPLFPRSPSGTGTQGSGMIGCFTKDRLTIKWNLSQEPAVNDFEVASDR